MQVCTIVAHRIGAWVRPILQVNGYAYFVQSMSLAIVIVELGLPKLPIESPCELLFNTRH